MEKLIIFYLHNLFFYKIKETNNKLQISKEAFVKRLKALLDANIIRKKKKRF